MFAGDKADLVGMVGLLADSKEIDIEELEKELYSDSAPVYERVQKTDYLKDYTQELNNLKRVSEVRPADKPSRSNENVMGAAPKLEGDDDDDDNNDDDEPIKAPASYGNPYGNSYGNSYGNTYGNTSTKYSTAIGKEKLPSERKKNNYKDNNYYMELTNDEKKQSQIKNFFQDIDREDEAEGDLVKQEEEEDAIAMMLEQIDMLKTNLAVDGVNLDKIPQVDGNSDFKSVKQVLRILQIKNDRQRYGAMFEEVILAGSYFLESIFDGKKDWFGTRVNLVGWSESVKVKLNRMKYDTSTFVGNVMKGYDISPGWRILLELLPSLVIYSRERRTRNNDNLCNDDEYRDAINNLNNGN